MEDNILDEIDSILEPHYWNQGFEDGKKAARNSVTHRQIQALVEQQVLIGQRAELEDHFWCICEGCENYANERVAEIDRQIALKAQLKEEYKKGYADGKAQAEFDAEMNKKYPEEK